MKPLSQLTETEIRVYLTVLRRERACYKITHPLYSEKEAEIMRCERELIDRLKLEGQTNAS